MNDIDKYEEIVADSIESIARKYGVDSCAVMDEVKKYIPTIQNQERIKVDGYMFTATGHSIPQGTKIALTRWQAELVHDAAKDVKYRSMHRAGVCKVIKMAV